MSSASPTSSQTSRGRLFLSWFPVDEFFSLDLRSLAVFRIGLGFMVLLEWFVRMVDLHAHYCDDGCVPRSYLGPLPMPFSLFFFSGEAWFVLTLMLIGCVFAVLLMVGWRTQFATLVSWVLIIGILGRCPLVVQGGDFVMRLLLFWGIFLPLGACYSLDALRGPPEREWRPQVLSFGSVALILQIAFIYWFAAAWKSNDVWRKDFTAVYMALSLEEFSTPLGHWLLNFPKLLHVLTASTMLLEIFGPVFLFMPFAQGPFRFAAVVAFCCFHAGLGACIELGNFPWICGVAWLGLLPTWFWDQLEARLHSPLRAGLTIYYDNSNAWHRKLVEAARMFLLLYDTKVLPAAPGERHAGRLRDGGPWVVVDHTGKLRVQYDAFLYLVWVSPLYWPLSYLLLWRPLRAVGERLLSWVANRQSHKVKVDLTPYPGAQLGGLLQNTIVVFCLVYVLLFNLRSLDGSAHKTEFTKYFPDQLNCLGLSLGIDQSWGLFAPYPGRQDGWYIIPAELTNGKIVDIYKDGAPATRAKPERMADTYANSRWRKMQLTLTYPQHIRMLQPYSRWVFHQWNEHHGPDEQIVHMQVIFRYKETLPDRQPTPAEYKDMPLWWYGEYPLGAIAAAVGPTVGPAVYEMAANRPLLPPLPGHEPQPVPGETLQLLPGDKPGPVLEEKPKQ